MGDQQCGLCLSCGVPMMPKPESLDTYTIDRGFLSLLHLNNEFRIAASMAKFEKPGFTSIVNKAHVFHQAQHKEAVLYMIHKHRGDRDVAEVAPRARAQRSFTFYLNSTSKTNKQPQIAWWPRPDRDERIKLRKLRAFTTRTVDQATDKDRFGEFLEVDSLEEMYKTCRDCNSAMTQQARFSALLQDVDEGGLITDMGNLTVVKAKTRVGDEREDWRRDGDAVVQDAMAPRVAYYLHMCMPYTDNPGQHWFMRVAGAGRRTRRAMRGFYVQQSWLILQISCLCGARQRSEVHGAAKLSNGYKAYLGSLDFYISYFCWRCFLFEHGESLHRSLDFVQWHQKYMWHARGCQGLTLPRKQTIGEAVTPGPNRNAQSLVESVQRRLMRLYRRRLRPLTDFLRGAGGVPSSITHYFLPPAKLPSLIRVSSRGGELSLDDALRNVGVAALFSQVVQLCSGYPDDVRKTLRDFTHSWRLREVGNIAFNGKDVDARTASFWYDLAHALDPPRTLPEDRGQLQALLRGPKCSPWLSVAALRSMQAFKERRAPDE